MSIRKTKTTKKTEPEKAQEAIPTFAGSVQFHETPAFLRAIGCVPFEEMKGTEKLDPGSLKRLAEIKVSPLRHAVWFVPKPALQILGGPSRSIRQRTLSMAYVKTLAQSVDRGNWNPLCAMFLFLATAPDKLADGQHRIEGLLRANVDGVLVMVRWNCTEQDLIQQAAKRKDMIHELLYRMLPESCGQVAIGRCKQFVSLVQLWLNPYNPRRVTRDDITPDHVLKLCVQLWDAIAPILSGAPIKCCFSKPFVQLPAVLAVLEGGVTTKDLRHARAIIDGKAVAVEPRFKAFELLRKAVNEEFRHTQEHLKAKSLPDTEVCRLMMLCAFEAFAALRDGRELTKFSDFDGNRPDEIAQFANTFKVRCTPAEAWSRPYVG